MKNKSNIFFKMTTTIYTLELENNKYYVGRSSVPEHRILKHFQNEGSEYTKLNKPIKVLSYVNGDSFDEEKHTLIAMDKYGIDNVRGGSYCTVKLSQHDKDKALQTFRSINDKCYKCGSKGHFVKDCTGYLKCNDSYTVVYDKNCPACLGSGISYWSDGCYGECFVCG